VALVFLRRLLADSATFGVELVLLAVLAAVRAAGRDGAAFAHIVCDGGGSVRSLFPRRDQIARDTACAVRVYPDFHVIALVVRQISRQLLGRAVGMKQA
jgi:hypothetical protein